MVKFSMYSMDGGALLQHILWKKGATCNEILNMYTKCVIKNYGQAIIEIDGYLSSLTKDMTHPPKTLSLNLP